MQEPQSAARQTHEPALARHMISRRVSGQNTWLGYSNHGKDRLTRPANQIEPEILESEEAVGRAQLEELKEVARAREGDIVMILLGGRGAQAMYRIIGELAQTSELNHLLRRLHVFTQDALAPMRMDNSLSFVRDFERLLGDAFFQKVKSFTPMQTHTDDLEAGLTKYIERLEALGGIDIFFLGLGPEANAASHLCYIKPGCGATVSDIAGIIPISQSILEHHINKFKVGGSAVTERDEAECRGATHILTLGPAAILGARRIVQSIVDASTAPAKRECYARFLETELADDPQARAHQLDDNPGLWLRLHPNVRSLVLPDVMN
jgi:6-phosphogluconolactonase/glucosamine-6-phosphate isomerase/deaminase